MKKSTLTFIVLISLLLVMGGLFGSYRQSTKDQKRSEDMKRCVELTVFPEAQPSSSSKPPISYQIRFEDEFFCPTQPYTALEALERAESVLNTRGQPLHVILKNTQDGIFLESMANKANTDTHTWELEINSNEKVTKPLDKIILQGKAYIYFYYR